MYTPRAGSGFHSQGRRSDREMVSDARKSYYVGYETVGEGQLARA